jgi:hypothetical protein
MKKVRAILFLIKAMSYVAYRIFKGRTWNIIQVSLENNNGERTNITYKKSYNGYELNEWSL